MSSQNTISPAHVLFVHFSCPCPVRILPILPMSNQNTISTAHVQSECHPPAHVQSVYELYCSCPVNNPSPQPMSQFYTISTIHVKTCPERIPSLQPMSMSKVKYDPIYVTPIPILLSNSNTMELLFCFVT